jgi:hypothetical protein
MKHTPLPWIIHEEALELDPQYASEWPPLITAWNEQDQFTEDICEVNKNNEDWISNAEFIVHACNCHYELVEALKTFMRLEVDRRAGCQLEPLDYAECYQLGLNAIAKAIGKEV